MSLSAHQRPHRGATDVWLTPLHIIGALGPFDLDPCAAVSQPWPTAAVQWTVDDDGLAQTWKGFAWVNPPFGPEAGKWLARLAEHGNGIGLVPARTETRWFVSQVWERADAVLFLHGRPHFHHPDGTRGAANSGAPICLAAYGATAMSRLAACELPGSLVSHWRGSRSNAASVALARVEVLATELAAEPDSSVFSVARHDTAARLRAALTAGADQ